MVALVVLTLEVKLEGGLGDWDEPQSVSKKELGKDQPSLNIMKNSSSMFNMELSFDIKSNQGRLELSHQLEL